MDESSLRDASKNETGMPEQSASPSPQRSPASATGAQSDAAQHEAAQRAALEDKLAATQARLDALTTQREVDAALLMSGVLDLEAGRALVTQLLDAQTPAQRDAAGGDCVARVRQAVAVVKQRQAYLFAPAGGSGPRGRGATGVPGLREGGESALDAAARVAMETGDRKAVDVYMRLRRGV